MFVRMMIKLKEGWCEHYTKHFKIKKEDFTNAYAFIKKYIYLFNFIDVLQVKN